MINYEHLFPVIPFSFVGAGPCDNDNIVYNTVNCTENFRIIVLYQKVHTSISLFCRF